MIEPGCRIAEAVAVVIIILTIVSGLVILHEGVKVISDYSQQFMQLMP